MDAEKLQEVLACHPAERGELIALLGEVQGIFGYLSSEALEAVAAHCGVSLAEATGAATFYDRFRFNAPGRYSVRVCDGTACHVRGSALIVAEWERQLGISCGQTTEDGLFDLDTVPCVGCCSIAPVVLVNDEVHGQTDCSAVKSAVDVLRSRG